MKHPSTLPVCSNYPPGLHYCGKREPTRVNIIELVKIKSKVPEVRGDTICDPSFLAHELLKSIHVDLG